jgi:hypothetical protein
LAEKPAFRVFKAFMVYHVEIAHKGEGVAVPKGSIREQIDQRKFGKKIKQALRRVLNGEPYRSAALAERVDHAHLWRCALSIDGMCEAHLRAWRGRWKGDFPQVWEHFLTKLCKPEATKGQH